MTFFLQMRHRQLLSMLELPTGLCPVFGAGLIQPEVNQPYFELRKDKEDSNEA